MSIEKIRERAEAATQGPFEVMPSPRFAQSAVVNRKTKLGIRMNLMSIAHSRTPVLQLADAELLAHAREDILTLLDLVDDVRESVEAMYDDVALAERHGLSWVANFLRKYADAFDGAIILPEKSNTPQ